MDMEGIPQFQAHPFGVRWLAAAGIIAISFFYMKYFQYQQKKVALPSPKLVEQHFKHYSRYI